MFVLNGSGPSLFRLSIQSQGTGHGAKAFFFIQFSGLQHTESGLCTYLVLVRKCFFLFGAISCWFRRKVANSPVDDSTSNVKAGLGA